MSEKKPTKAQLRVLEAMRDGRAIHWSGGLRPYAWLAGGRMETVNVMTVLAMRRAGWISGTETRVQSIRYTLTESGRAALGKD
mgnify:CR=1 FL=1